MQVAVIDYGAGNIRSVCDAIDRVGYEPIIVETPEDILASERLILPGVGASNEALTKLREKNLEEAITEVVSKKGRPLLGICLGMQMLADTLFEFGQTTGLGWIKGTVRPIAEMLGPHSRVPHMGWNSVKIKPDAEHFFKGVRKGREFYFAHSYSLVTDDKTGIAATVNYCGVDIIAAVQFDSVFATQFHPEKSQHNGERLMTAFMEWNP